MIHQAKDKALALIAAVSFLAFVDDYFRVGGDTNLNKIIAKKIQAKSRKELPIELMI